jgi:hypothetical protein
MNRKNIPNVQLISIILLSLFLFSFLLFTSTSIFAEESSQNVMPNPDLDAPTFETIDFDYQKEIGEFVKYIIIWAFRFAGIFAFIMILFAGFQYLTAGGNTNQQKEAQERIFNAIIGIILLFSFWLILNTINPDILGEKEIYVPSIQEEKEDIEEQTEIIKNLTKINGKLPLTSELESYDSYLNKTLVNKLIGLTNGWVVTDACIDSVCSKTTISRRSDDCHLDGTCVDIAAVNNADNYNGNNADNYNMISTFTDAGLYVLYEGNHLHITLPSASGYGTYQGITNITQGTWYLP